jgi:group I intron endonuclease
LVCLVTGKGYVGQTIKPRVEVRWLQHIRLAFVKNDSRPLYRAMRKYGLKNFTAEVIWTGPESKLNAAEKRFVQERRTFIDTGWGYNLTTGGDRYKLSGAAVRKLRLGVKAAYDNDLTLAKRIGAANRGKKRSAETKALLSKLAIIQFSTAAGRRKAAKAGKKRFEAPVERRWASIVMTRRMAVAANRCAASIATTKQFASERARTKASRRAVARYKNRPELRAIVGKDSKRRWADEVEREKIMARLRPIWSSEAHKKVCSIAQKKRFANPAERKRASESKKAAWALVPEWRKEEIRQSHIIAANKPATKERNKLASLKWYAEHPVTKACREKMSVSGKKAWATRKLKINNAKNNSVKNW